MLTHMKGIAFHPRNEVFCLEYVICALFQEMLSVLNWCFAGQRAWLNDGKMREETGWDSAEDAELNTLSLH